MRLTRFSPLLALSFALFPSCAEPEPVEEPVAQAASKLGQGFAAEKEPNNTAATATPLVSHDTVVRAALFPNADVDYYSFTAVAGDRVYAATMTAFAAFNSDSSLDLLDVDGVTVLQYDYDNGSFTSFASSIAGAQLPAAGKYFLRVKSPGSSTLGTYDLHVRIQSGAPVSEVEPNDTVASAQPLPVSGWINGNTSSVADVDYYSIALNAGDTVFASLDLDPLIFNISIQWNGKLGIGPFNGKFLTADDPGGTGPDAVFFPDSEALFTTVKTTGLYYIMVGASPPAPSHNPSGAYHLSVSVHPAAVPPGICTTYTSADVPKNLVFGFDTVTSTITIPGHPRIADLDVGLNLDYTKMSALDVDLMSPAGNDNLLFTDIGSAAETSMDILLDDEAALPIGTFDVVKGLSYTPEVGNLLSWFDGEDAGGTWTLVVHGQSLQNNGMLNGWNLTVCEPPTPPPPSCPPGTHFGNVYITDFEGSASGFTHSGVLDSWQRGTPAFPPIVGCNSGTKCFKTKLNAQYDPNTSQDLRSPAINLVGIAGPIVASWAQKYQMDSADVDHLFVDVAQLGNVNPMRLFEWQGTRMHDFIGSQPTPINESAGWGIVEADISAYAGQVVQLRYHLDSNPITNYAGFAVDDVKVTGCLNYLCGDGMLGGPELCDDGNLVDGDGCDSNCTPTACGNGIKSPAEACDDGNLVDGDGCDSNCTLTGCGNGIKTAGEVCDDGNLVSGDGCDANCKLTACGNGITTAGELCDDGNLVNGDGCDKNCTPTGCGNGIKTVGESCDDGNGVNGDGCDVNCKLSGCGNGIVAGAEQCDDGNLNNGDGCSSTCMIESSTTASSSSSAGSSSASASSSASSGTGGASTSASSSSSGVGASSASSSGVGASSAGSSGVGGASSAASSGVGGATSAGSSGVGGGAMSTGSGGSSATASSGEVATASSGSGGGAGSTGLDAGCGCATPGGAVSISPWTGLLALLALRRRRRAQA